MHNQVFIQKNQIFVLYVALSRDLFLYKHKNSKQIDFIKHNKLHKTPGPFVFFGGVLNMLIVN